MAFFGQTHTCAQAWLLRSQLWSKSCVTTVAWSCAPTDRPAEKQAAWLNRGVMLAGLRPFLAWHLSYKKKPVEMEPLSTSMDWKLGELGLNAHEG